MSYAVWTNNISCASLGQSTPDWVGVDISDRLEICKYQEPTRTILTTELPRRGLILEAGCGIGSWVIYLESLGFNIVGLDLSENALITARKKNEKALFVVGDIRALPFRRSAFEAVISLGVIEHFSEGPKALLQEMKRVLKQRGYLYVTVPYENLMRKYFHRPYIRLGMLKKYFLRKECTFGEYRFSKVALINYLEQNYFFPQRIEYEELVCNDRSFALNVDWFRLFGINDKSKEFKLNKSGRTFKRILMKLPPKYWYGGLLCVARVN